MKVIKTGDEARTSMKKGIDLAVDLAKVTLGGKGRIVMIDRPGSVHSTLDGITVLANTAMNDKTEDMGVKLVLEAADKQNMECADGTTSVSIVLQALIDGGMKALSTNADPLLVKQGIELASKVVISALEDISIKVTRQSKEIQQVAIVSAHGDKEIGELVAEAISRTGEDSIITIEESSWANSLVEVTDGIKVNSGWLDADFITNNDNQTAELLNPLILIYEGKILAFKELVGNGDGLIFKVNETKRPFLIISDQLQGEPLFTLLGNKVKNGFPYCAINPFGFSREDVKFRLQDLAIATGAKVITPDLGHKLDDVKLEDLGQAEKVIVSRKDTVFINGKADKQLLGVRIKELKQQLKEAKNPFEKSMIEGRLAAINGGVGIIFIGGTMSTDIKEKKDRADDALGAALSSLENGVVPGGGISLLLAKKSLASYTHPIQDVNIGIRILADALESPFRQIIKNAGGKVDVILDKIENGDSKIGYDVVKGEYIDMIKEGILDPTKVEINIICNAVSVACRFLTTEGLITNVEDKK